MVIIRKLVVMESGVSGCHKVQWHHHVCWRGINAKWHCQWQAGLCGMSKKLQKNNQKDHVCKPVVVGIWKLMWLSWKLWVAVAPSCATVMAASVQNGTAQWWLNGNALWWLFCSMSKKLLKRTITWTSSRSCWHQGAIGNGAIEWWHWQCDWVAAWHCIISQCCNSL